jgi:GT2 family glycosyltransferase
VGQAGPVFSIIVPTHDRPAQLAVCLQAIASLDYPRDRFEVIVVDDGGAEPLEAIVAAVRSRLAVTVIKQRRGGPAAARNAGAARARGELLAFTDDDCAPDRGWLEALATRFATSPDRLIGGAILNALPANAYSTTSQAIADVTYAHFNANGDQARFLSANNLAVRADQFRAVGGFDPAFVTSEDRDFCDRWLHRGLLITYAPEAVVHHAHRLTLRTFLRQHFDYGRGTLHFHRARAGRGQERVRADRIYYLALLRYPFSRALGWRAWCIAGLLIAAHAAKAAGVLREKMAARLVG